MNATGESILVTIGLLLAAASPVLATEPTALDGLAKFVNSDFRRVDDRRRELLANPPPARPPLARCATLGYHSIATYSPNSVRWVQIDLGERRQLDTVVVVPAAGPPGQSGPGYFFPAKLRIELADRADLADAVTAAEVDVASGDRPLVVSVSGRAARYLRVVGTQLASRGSLHFFAVGEVLALAGNRNLAAGRPVTASDSLENAPVWGLRNLVDGQGIVGPPLGPGESSTNGYHSGICPHPDEVKWVQVDLGAELPLEEVRLVPARPRDFADRSGFGFPVRFRVEAATRDDFRSGTMLLDAAASDFPNPGDGLVVIPADGVRARFIRVTATRLWERTADYVFALAELQVYSDGKNVARGATVTALDSIERGLWCKAYLVDGLASQNRLIEWPEWAEDERQAAEWEAQWRASQAHWEAARAKAYSDLVSVAGVFVGGVVLLVAGLIWRGRVLRRRETERLRDRIARDLHDEVGSNLGGILLLAQAGNANDLPEIGRVAQRTAESLRDLVWLMGRGPDTSADLLAKLRESAAALLVGVEFTFTAPDGCLPDRVSLEFKRQIFLAFKEILHNIARHARATAVDVRCCRVGARFVFEVRDDGVGFDPQKATAGTGLRGLRFRATTLGGNLTVETAPGRGCTIRFDVPLG